MKKIRKKIILVLFLIVVVSTLFFTQCFFNPLSSGGSTPVEFLFNISKLFNGIRVKITWSAVKGALYYQVYRSEAENTDFEQIAVLTNLSSTTQSIITTTTAYDRILDLATKYYYKIKAYKPDFGWTSLLGSGSVTTGDDYEDDDNSNEANEIKMGETQSHSISEWSFSDAYDNMYLMVNSVGQYVTTISPVGNGYNIRVDIYFHDSNDNLLNHQICMPGNTISITNNFTNTGKYNISVYGGLGYGIGEYNITVNTN